MTNDGATILSLLDIEHPAGKILVDLAQQQDKEVLTIHFGGCHISYMLTSPRSETAQHLLS